MSHAAGGYGRVGKSSPSRMAAALRYRPKVGGLRFNIFFAIKLYPGAGIAFGKKGTRSMAAKELERMSLRELQEHQLKVKKALASAQDRNRAELRKKIETMV